MKAQFQGIYIGSDSPVTFEEKGEKYSVKNATFQEVENNVPVRGKYIVAQAWNSQATALDDFSIGELLNIEVDVTTRRAKVDPTRQYNKIAITKMTCVYIKI
jgi:hypothetical protein